MKLAAIYNAWADGTDFLKKSIDNISPVVDLIIVVYSVKSNYGHYKNWVVENHLNKKSYPLRYEPKNLKAAYMMEFEKRNMGLEYARNLGCTHFLMMDCDEFYFQKDIQKEKADIEERGVIGKVCRLQTYFSSPTLTIGLDTTLVPFIHQITRKLKFELDSKTYPFAYDKDGAHIDPTRRLNITEGIEMSDVIMHHYSWVRSDYDLKINNSSARNNLLKSNIKEDLKNAKPGSYCSFYKKNLIKCENFFNL